MIEWLQADCDALEAWKEASLAQNVITEPVHKWVLSGKTVASPASAMLNGLPLRAWLPAPRVLAWLRAFKEVNQEFLVSLLARARGALCNFDEEGLGQNGMHFMHADFETWFLSAAEIHVFDRPAGCFEPRHNDGGASILHMGLTLFGRRCVTFFVSVIWLKDCGYYCQVLSLIDVSTASRTGRGHSQHVSPVSCTYLLYSCTAFPSLIWLIIR